MRIGPYRAAARIAWRQAKRAPWRTALILAMVALPITTLVFVATLISTAITTPEEEATAELGSAELRIDDYRAGFDPERLARALPAGTRIVPHVTTAGVQLFTDDDPTSHLVYERIYVELEELARIDRAPVDGMYVLQEGRAAIEAGEAVVHPAVLDVLGTSVGETVTVRGLELRITGTALRPLNLSSRFIVAASGTLNLREGKFGIAYLVDVPDGADVRAAIQTVRADPAVRTDKTRAEAAALGENEAGAQALTFAGGTLALGALGLIAAAAFAVGARRQLRALGLVAAVGGARRDVRAVVLLGGTVLGALGSAIGTGLGMLGALLALPHLSRFTETLPGPLEPNWFALVGALGLGTIASTLAASLPARTASRIPPMQALAGRTPPPRKPGRLAWIGLGVFLLGIPITLTGTRDNVGATIGLGALGGGLLLAIPLAVTVLGRVATRLPATIRMAARDAARYGRRTGPALAATTLALSGGVLAASAAAGDAAYWSRIVPLTDEQMLVDLHTEKGRIDELAGALPGASVATLDRIGPKGGVDSAGVWITGASLPHDEHGFVEEVSGPLWLGTPVLAHAMNVPPVIDALRTDHVVALGLGSTSEGEVTLSIDGRGEQVVRAIEVDARAPQGETLPRFMISESGARRLGLQVAPPEREAGADLTAVQALVRMPRQVTPQDVERVGEAFSGSRSFVYIQTTDDWLPATVGLRPIALGLAAAVALLIVGAALALVGAESRRDRAILAAVGADPGTRRRLSAAGALLLTTVAGLIAVPAGIAPFAVYQWGRDDGYPVVMPWDGIAAVVIGVPLLAGLAAFLLARRPGVDAMLRPLT